MILGVPFLRNVYTVMAYTPPNSDGTFPDVGNATNDGGAGQVVKPRLGLLGLTDPTVALQEFNTVRVLNQPIESGVPSSSNSGSNGNTRTVGKSHISVGIWVLIGLAAFCALCGGLFAIRYFLFRRRFRRAGGRMGPDYDEGLDAKTAYRLARSNFGSNRTLNEGLVPMGLNVEDEMRYRALITARKEKRSDSTVDSDRTRVNVSADDSFLDMKGKDGEDDEGADEFGYPRRSQRLSTGSDGEQEGWNAHDATVIAAARRGSHHSAGDSGAVQVPLVSGHRSSSSSGSAPSSPEHDVTAFSRPQHHYTDSDPPDTPLPPMSLATPIQPHKPTLSVDQPLLPHHQRGLSSLSDGSMYDDAPPLPPQHQHRDSDAVGYSPDDLLVHETSNAEFGGGVGMAGVGTASRTGRAQGLERWAS